MVKAAHLAAHLIVGAAAFLALMGCTASYRQVDNGGANRASVHLDASRAVLVTMPADGRYKDVHYPGSGVTVARSVAAAFAKHANHVDIDAAPAERTALLDEARRKGDGYLAIPTIAHWERRATFGTGRPSRASIAIAVVDAATGEQVTSSLLEGRTRIYSWTETDPESLLPEMVGKYVDGLY